VVITDAVMPNVSGYELCRFVRKAAGISVICR
jgi:PleD family two-component response regulator